MLFIRIVLVILIAAAGRVAADQCSRSSIITAESELRSIQADVSTADSLIARLESELRTVSDEIAAIRDEAESNPFKRRRLDHLLGESREKAGQLETIGANRASKDELGGRIRATLRECYGDSLSASLRRLIATVESRQFERARDEMAVVRIVEDRLAGLAEQETPAEDYPVISEEFFNRSLGSLEDRLFLIDTVDDLLDKALADSTRAGERLFELQESIRLKKDLMRLVSQARQGGLDRGAFFESFGRDDPAAEISKLENKADAAEAALAEAAAAAKYYRDRKAGLVRESRERKE